MGHSEDYALWNIQGTAFGSFGILQHHGSNIWSFSTSQTKEFWEKISKIKNEWDRIFFLPTAKYSCNKTFRIVSLIQTMLGAPTSLSATVATALAVTVRETSLQLVTLREVTLQPAMLWAVTAPVTTAITVLAATLHEISALAATIQAIIAWVATHRAVTALAVPLQAATLLAAMTLLTAAPVPLVRAKWATQLRAQAQWAIPPLVLAPRAQWATVLLALVPWAPVLLVPVQSVTALTAQCHKATTTHQALAQWASIHQDLWIRGIFFKKIKFQLFYLKNGYHPSSWA